ncbi:porin family protein [Marinobacter sp.]|uniref:porin family protein n=1 Tax=Marinobacter sp. TaxID=50741 RepID=UPI003850BE7B
MRLSDSLDASLFSQFQPFQIPDIAAVPKTSLPPLPQNSATTCGKPVENKSVPVFIAFFIRVFPACLSPKNELPLIFLASLNDRCQQLQRQTYSHGGNMNRIFIAISASAIIFSVSPAQAQKPIDQGYLGANYIFLTYEEDGFSEDFDLGALVGKAGAKLTPYFAAELRAGFGVADESVSANGFTGELELDYLVGGYAVGGIPNETPFYPYVVIGYTKGELTASVSGPGGSASISESESDLSYGVGADFFVTERFLVNAEYMKYLDKDDFEISGISVGGTIMF